MLLDGRALAAGTHRCLVWSYRVTRKYFVCPAVSNDLCALRFSAGYFLIMPSASVFHNRPIYDSIRYIEHNPVRKGLVGQAQAWEWSSAWNGGTVKYVRPVVDRGSVPVMMR